MNFPYTAMILTFLGIVVLLTVSVSARQQEGSSCFPNNAIFVDVEWGNSYFVCRNQRIVRVFCPPLYFLNPKTLRCEYGTRPPNPWPTTTQSTQICVPGTRSPYPFDNTKYRQCNWDGKSWNVLYCQPNSIFNASLSICVEYVTPTPSTTPSTTPYYGSCVESGGAAGYKPDIRSCQHYYQCASGVWIQRPCPAGTVWNQQLLTCDHNRGQCRPGHPNPPSTTYSPYSTTSPNEV